MEAAQGTQDWLEWRRQGIGSSDAPVVMLASPWRTPLQLWEEKTGLVQPDPNPDYIQAKGHRVEPKARALYELECDLDMPPKLFQHAEYPFLRASLDGYNEKEGRILEIKLVGKEDFDLALKEKKVPEKYTWQLHHQQLVTGAERVDYYCAMETARGSGQVVGALVPFYADRKAQKQLFDEECRFWELVEKRVPPELCDRDFRKVRDKEVVELAKEFKMAKALYEFYDERLKELKKEFEAKVGRTRFICNGVRGMPISRAGNVNYKKIPELKGVDLEKYRGKPVEYMDIRVVEK